jgi:hypothetical protein
MERETVARPRASWIDIASFGLQVYQSFQLSRVASILDSLYEIELGRDERNRRLAAAKHFAFGYALTAERLDSDKASPPEVQYLAVRCLQNVARDSGIGYEDLIDIQDKEYLHKASTHVEQRRAGLTEKHPKVAERVDAILDMSDVLEDALWLSCECSIVLRHIQEVEKRFPRVRSSMPESLKREPGPLLSRDPCEEVVEWINARVRMDDQEDDFMYTKKRATAELTKALLGEATSPEEFVERHHAKHCTYARLARLNDHLKTHGHSEVTLERLATAETIFRELHDDLVQQVDAGEAFLNLKELFDPYSCRYDIILERWPRHLDFLKRRMVLEVELMKELAKVALSPEGRKHMNFLMHREGYAFPPVLLEKGLQTEKAISVVRKLEELGVVFALRRRHPLYEHFFLDHSKEAGAS